ncbi:MAG: ROK family transcriptional regulator [Clostridia bacterium]
MIGSQTSPQRSLRVSKPANSLLQNRINISIIFNYLRDNGASYRARIARDLGISAPAVARAVEKLLVDEYVIESERIQMENGRKAAQVSVNAERGCIIGVDLLSDPIKLGISDFAGNFHDFFLALPKNPAMDFTDYIIASIDTALQDFRKKTRNRKVRILALGLGVPAVVDPQTGEILYANYYGKFIHSHFYSRLVDHYSFPVFIENTANLSVIGEWKHGVGRGARNLVFLEYGNGIGAGIILEGDLYRGAQGAAGEIGYFITTPDGLGYDGSTIGYLESKASLESMYRRGGMDSALESGGYQTAAALFTAASSGDETALGILSVAIKHLTVAIVNILLVLNPEMIIIGGATCELPGADSLILNPLIDAVRKFYPFAPAPIYLASIGANACLAGSVQFALDSLVVHAYPYRL